MRRSLLLLALLAVPAAAQTSQDPAVAAWAKGDYATAIAAWEARPADGEALYNLGQAYRLGRGVPADKDQAIQYYRQAVIAGYPKAEEQLGLILFDNDASRPEALRLLQSAADRGAPRASFVMGLAHMPKGWLESDPAKARVYLEKAAAGKVPGAADALASLPAPRPAPAAELPVLSQTVTSAGKTAAKIGAAVAVAAAPTNTAPEPAAFTAWRSRSDAWTISLGEFDTMALASSRWVRVSARKRLGSYPMLIEPIGGKVRLIFGAFPQATAEQLCKQLASDKIACTAIAGSP